MNTQSHMRLRILFWATLFILTGFMSMQKAWAQCAMSPAKSANHGGLTPDTLLVKLQVDPNGPPIELALKQFMEKYNIPRLSVVIIDN